MIRASYRIAVGLLSILALGACAQFGTPAASAGSTATQVGATPDFDVVSNRPTNPRAIYQGRPD